MKIPDKIDLKQLEEAKKKNSEERLKFIDQYAAWVKKTSNKRWSSQQKDLIH
jgi:hypothetical protein